MTKNNYWNIIEFWKCIIFYLLLTFNWLILCSSEMCHSTVNYLQWPIGFQTEQTFDAYLNVTFRYDDGDEIKTKELHIIVANNMCNNNFKVDEEKLDCDLILRFGYQKDS